MTASNDRLRVSAQEQRDNAIGLTFIAVLLLLAVLALGSAPLWI
ncbi:MAG: hypothetical protein ABI336_04685 [Humibacillus sp.]